MRKISLLSFVMVMFLVVGCGSEEAQNAVQTEAKKEEIRQNQKDGLMLTVKNELPADPVGNGATNAPNILTYVCSPATAGLRSALLSVLDSKERCALMEGPDKNSQSQAYHVSQHDLAIISDRGHGKVSFEFSDDNSDSTSMYPCKNTADGATEFVLDNLNSLQEWTVTVGARTSDGYSCVISRE